MGTQVSTEMIFELVYININDLTKANKK